MKKGRSLKVNAALNATKQICAIIFPLISFSYSSRVLGATGIGIYSFGNSIVSYMLLISALGLSNYATREGAAIRDNREKFTAFAKEVYSINLIMTFFAYVVLASLLVFWNKLVSYRETILIQSIAIILTTLGADWVNSVFEDYIYITIRYIVVQIISLICLLLFVRTPEDLFKYVFIATMATVGGNIFNIFYIKRYVKLKFVLHTNFKKHIVPMLILFANSVALTIYLNSDITILGVLSTDSNVGIYTIATKIYTLVKTVINALVFVTVPRFSFYLAHDEKYKYDNTFSNIYNVLLLLISPVAVGLFVEAKKVLVVVAGEEYISGACSLRILCVAIAFGVLSCLYCYSVLMPNRLEKYFLYSTIIAAIMNILLNVVLIPYFNMAGAAATTLIAEAVVFFFTKKYSRGSVALKINKECVIDCIIGSAGIIGICLLINSLILNQVIQLIGAISLSMIYYLIVLLARQNVYIISALQQIKSVLIK